MEKTKEDAVEIRDKAVEHWHAKVFLSCFALVGYLSCYLVDLKLLVP